MKKLITALLLVALQTSFVCAELPTELELPTETSEEAQLAEANRLKEEQRAEFKKLAKEAVNGDRKSLNKLFIEATDNLELENALAQAAYECKNSNDQNKDVKCDRLAKLAQIAFMRNAAIEVEEFNKTQE